MVVIEDHNILSGLASQLSLHLEKQGINLQDLNPEQAYDYFAQRIGNGTQGYQLNHYIKALNTWCKFREINHEFKTYKEYEKPIKTPTAKDINQIIKCCGRSRKGKRTKTIISYSKISRPIVGIP